MTSGARPVFSKELQSLRGIAALIVLLGHCLGVFSFEPGSAADRISLLLNGGGAVTFFFVLSGTVLALSLQRFTLSPRAYAGYGFRRVSRIMPMIAVAVIAGTIYGRWIDHHASYSFASAWFTEHYKEPMDLPRFVAAFVGYCARPSAPLWSIFVELIGSAFLPFFVICCRRRLPMILGAGALLFLSFQDLSSFKYTWPVFLVDFYVGVTILSWGPAFARALTARGRGFTLGVLLACGAVLALNRGWIWHYRGHGDPVTNLIELIAATVVVAFTLYSPEGFPILRRQPMVFLGDISYSLYLLHFILMCLLVQWMVGIFGEAAIQAHWPLYCVLLMAALTVVSLAVSTVTYRSIEIPLANWGKKLAARWFSSEARPEPAPAPAFVAESSASVS